MVKRIIKASTVYSIVLMDILSKKLCILAQMYLLVEPKVEFYNRLGGHNNSQFFQVFFEAPGSGHKFGYNHARQVSGNGGGGFGFS